MHDALGVSPGREAVAATLEFGAYFGIVVALTVEDDPDALILVGDRLVATAHVNNRQTAYGQTHARIDVEAVAVGAAVGDSRIHPFEQRALRLALVRIGYSTNATHV